MKCLDVPFIPNIDKNTSIEAISAILDTLVKSYIDKISWPKFPYKPKVSFSIAFSDNCFLLKYYVVEMDILAKYTNSNGPVYKDSCVEFFIAFDNDVNYYNLEFNCVGTCHIGFGKEKEGRQLLPEPLIKNIKYQSKIKSDSHSKEPTVYWELTLIIPFEIFCHHNIRSLSEIFCRVNFYKCGDDLPMLHYLSWNEIISSNPNFHLPDFFAPVRFLNKPSIME